MLSMAYAPRWSEKANNNNLMSEASFGLEKNETQEEAGEVEEG